MLDFEILLESYQCKGETNEMFMVSHWITDSPDYIITARRQG
jgi:hypothetical protein